MALQKLVALADFLRSKNMFSAEQLDFWMEDGNASPSAKRVANGVLLCRFKYNGVISVERFAGNADLFLAHLCCWLQDFDASRNDDDLDEPKIDVTPLDDSTADIEVSIPFSEDITALPDDAGEIQFGARRYSLQDIEIQVARSVSVGNKTPLDAEYVRPEA